MFSIYIQVLVSGQTKIEFPFLFMSTDQTPTPTRFLKNCEEVGLFNELANSFEHEFKKAADEDEKKVRDWYFAEKLVVFRSRVFSLCPGITCLID